MHNIEIGMTVVGKLYLHCVGLDKPTAFDIRYIEGVEDGDAGTVVKYLDKVYGSNDYENKRVSMPFLVEESREEIEEAIKEAESYRDAALEKINSMLE